MESMQEIETLLTGQLLSRGLERVPGQMAFVHKEQAVALKADTTIYRGFYISVLERGYTVREFRSRTAAFDWDTIAATIVGVAERRAEPRPPNGTGNESGVASKSPDASLWKMIGAGLSSQLSLEPSVDSPGRVRVNMRGLDLDPVAALQLYAAVSRVLSPVL